MTNPQDKLLFTPGPITTSATVKQAMLRDLGSRDTEFIQTVERVRNALLSAAEVTKEQGYEAVILQGSGTFGLEAVVGSAIPSEGRLLVVTNGTYGSRFAELAQALEIDHRVLAFKEGEPVDPKQVSSALAEDPTLTHVSVVHCETSTGVRLLFCFI